MFMVLILIFSLCIVVQTCYVIWFLWTMGSKKNTTANYQSNASGISIIICAKNEAHNLVQNLPFILKQNYPNFEVVVVNDASDDDTEIILENFKKQFPQLQIVSIPIDASRNLKGKKFALAQGIATAKFERLLLTDADCTPASEYWLSLMTQNINDEKQIIAGVGLYRFRLNATVIFTAWETLHTYIQYSAYANSKMPYMAVGRNLATTKELILTAQKNELWNKLPSGDDDLLVQICATESNVFIQGAPASFTFSEAKTNWTSYFAQKQRHVSTGKLYSKKQQFLLALYAASHGLVWFLFILLMLAGHRSEILSLMILRCFITWMVWAIAAISVRQSLLILFFPIADFAWAIYNLILSPYIFFKTKKEWN